MKKLIMLAVSAVIAFGFIGCKEEPGSTLKWKNKSGEDVSTIRWKKSGSVDFDQEWNSGVPVVDTASTDRKNIEVLDGVGECIYGSGSPEQLTIAAGDADEEGIDSASASSASIKDNTDATLVIDIDATK